ncbi:Fic family protein [Chitinophaga lutea]
MATTIKDKILALLANHPGLSSREVFDQTGTSFAYATIKRTLNQLLDDGLIISEGRGRGTKYRLSEGYEVIAPVNVQTYFSQEQDERNIKGDFNLTLITEVIPQVRIFTAEEGQLLSDLHEKYLKNISGLSRVEYEKELERLAIDLSWKSSQIEGNTYSLLETERLLKEKETAEGKPKDDAIMLLNHKEALNFVIENPDYVVPLSVRGIEDIHSILIKDLGVDRNVRKRRVGITGTNYRPLDNEFQIKDALHDMCKLINSKGLVFEKALLALVLLSYIQAFADGNKRTARIVSNAILIAYKHCPLSFRTVDSIEYKKAMLIFYEQNNITAFKEIFINQYEFAVSNYF